MFGTVFAMLNTSAWSWMPSAAASSAPRAKPLIRLTTVPAAITAVELRTLRELATSSPAGLTVRSRGGAPPAQSTLDPAPDDHHDQQRHAGGHDRPDFVF